MNDKSPPRASLSLADMAGLVRSLGIYYGMPWRRRALRQFYGSLVSREALAFDIGAHVGSRTRSLLAVGARCIAVEPQPLFARLLQRLFKHEPRVTVITDAVGGQSGSAELKISSRHPTVSTLSQPWIEQVQAADGFENVSWDHKVSVSVVTLDAMIARFGLPDFCKIDVEGMEAEILSGLSHAIPLLAFEYVPASLHIAHQCIARLNTLGHYEFNWCVGESHRLGNTSWVARDAITDRLNEVASSGQSGDIYARLVVAAADVT